MSKYMDNKSFFLSPEVNQYGNHMVMTNVYQDTKTKYINIDTKYCDEYFSQQSQPTSPIFSQANYNITLPDKINNVKSLTITNVEIPVTYYNISSSLGNNAMKVSSNIGVAGLKTYTIVVPDGTYTIDSLVTTLNSLFSTNANNQGHYLVCSKNSSQRILFSINTGSNYFDVSFAVDASGNFDKYNIKNKLGWLFGFRDIQYRVNGGTNLTSECIFKPQFGYNYMYLAIDEFARGNQNSFISNLPKSSINKNIIAKIVVDEKNYPAGTLFPANIYNGYLQSDVRSYNGKIDIQKLNCQLLSDRGVPVNLNGNDFSFTIRMEYE
jgi:hypothetical protein